MNRCQAFIFLITKSLKRSFIATNGQIEYKSRCFADSMWFLNDSEYYESREHLKKINWTIFCKTKPTFNKALSKYFRSNCSIVFVVYTHHEKSLRRLSGIFCLMCVFLLIRNILSRKKTSRKRMKKYFTNTNCLDDEAKTKVFSFVVNRRVEKDSRIVEKFALESAASVRQFHELERETGRWRRLNNCERRSRVVGRLRSLCVWSCITKCHRR